MSDIKLFRFSNDAAEELAGRSALVERELHDLMERHMECFLGIRFVAHEYSTGKNHRGRIDSLGLDENCCPVIIEYKRILTKMSLTRACTTWIGCSTIKLNLNCWSWSVTTRPWLML